MNIQFLGPENATVVVVDDFYTDLEFVTIKNELLEIQPVANMNVLTNNEQVSREESGESKQQSNSLFLDHLFNSDRGASKALTVNRKLFKSDELFDALVKKNINYKHIRKVTFDSTLVNFYNVGGFYKPHYDCCTYTAISFFATNNLVGGELCFPEIDCEVESKENRLVIFPGCMEHGSKPVLTGTKISMVQFLTYRL